MGETTQVLGDKATLYVKNMALDVGIAASKRLDLIIKQAPNLTTAQVNKKILMLATKEKKAKPKIADDILKSIAKMSGLKKEKVIKEQEKTKHDATANYESYMSSAFNALSVVAEANRKIKAYLGQDENGSLDKQVLEIVENPFYQFIKVHGDELQFSTSEVVMRWEKKAAKLKYEIPLGRFLVKINVQSGAVGIWPFKDNMKARGQFIHPHIKNENGSMCWGNAATAVAKVALEGDIRPVMAAIEAYLPTYNEQSPYCDILYFQEEIDAKKFLVGKKGDRMLKPSDITISHLIHFAPRHILNGRYFSDLKHPVKYAKGFGAFATIAFTNRANNVRYLELKDGSFLEAGKFTSYSTSDARGWNGDSSDAIVDVYENTSSYYSKSEKTIDPEYFMGLTKNQIEMMSLHTSSGNSFSEILKAVKNVVG